MHTRRLSHILPLLTLLLVVPIGVSSFGTDPAHAAVDVIGDDEQDAFVGSGSLLLPPQIATDWRRSAASCPGCRWRSVVQCEMTTAGSCRGPARLCGVDGFWLRVYLTGPDGVERDLGAACFGPSGPVRRDVAEALMADEVRALVPPLRTWRQPAGQVLPHLPVVFGVTQSESALQRRFDLIDLPIELTASPRWIWDFGGTTLHTVSAGRPWPDQTIDRTFRRSGDVRVAVKAVWAATYTVAGVGPLEVVEPVTQDADVTVPVGQARAVLVR
ncbi:MAG: hypothetical protein NWR17_05035 [Candidatus Nanopelagicales bacterium]|nr:hypothetical protein [Candidatus Nanopelagicales bacterium]MDP4906612.1 hypothetical protein [Candidatus Nanopelagicales bacterium]MDP4974423.1 hypothetical protein [Candidatus Nanopelagicales bacterium]